MSALTLEVLQQLWPHGNQHVPGLLEGIIAAAPLVQAKYPGLEKPLVQVHALAQFSWEANAGLEMIENLNYSSTGLLKTFPTHFDRHTAARYAHNPRMIADIAYGGRKELGNAPPPSDDGWNYRGRGLPQITGRDEYEAVGKIVGLDLLDDPDLAIDPEHALEIGVADFVKCGCLPHAEADDVVAVTLHLNGGLNGLAGRRAWLAKWKKALL